jgi:hypothetical protein
MSSIATLAVHREKQLRTPENRVTAFIDLQSITETDMASALPGGDEFPINIHVIARASRRA